MNYVEINEDFTVTKTPNMSDSGLETAGTSLQDEFNASYEELLEVFGEPNGQSDGYKTDAEWEIKTPVGVATIYNWKDGHNYLGSEGSDVWDIKDWHIGGKSKSVVSYVLQAYLNNRPLSENERKLILGLVDDVTAIKNS